jgi:hypothetical protein
MSPTVFRPASCDYWDFLLWLESASPDDLERFGRDKDAEFLRFRTEDGKCDAPSGVVEVDGVMYEYAWPGRNLPSEDRKKSGSYARAYSYRPFWDEARKQDVEDSESVVQELHDSVFGGDGEIYYDVLKRKKFKSKATIDPNAVFFDDSAFGVL